MYYTCVINFHTTPFQWIGFALAVVYQHCSDDFLTSIYYICSCHYHKNGAFDGYWCVYWPHIFYYLGVIHSNHIDHQPYDYIHFHYTDNQLDDHIHIYHTGLQFGHIHFHYIDYQPDISLFHILILFIQSPWSWAFLMLSVVNEHTAASPPLYKLEYHCNLYLTL